jgi:hypothetical protein
MWIEIEGGSKEKRELIRDMSWWLGQRLLGKRLTNNIQINVAFKRDPKADGWCSWEDDNVRPREFEVIIRSGLNLKQTGLTFCHEFVHVKQFAKGELRDKFKGGYSQVWKGKAHTNTLYEDQPWEKEAYDLQDKLWKEYKESFND